MEYTLKDKLLVTQEFIDELTEKSWQEIEHVQSQIASLADTPEGNKVAKLLNNILTSYYVLAGSLENFNINDTAISQPIEVASTELPNEIIIEKESVEIVEPSEQEVTIEPESTVTEPFEYFVDFDDPIGEPLTDKDLYNN